MLTVKVEDEGLKIFLNKITPQIRGTLKKEVQKQSRALRDYIVVRHLTGGTSADRLAVRSGNLRRNTRPLPIESSKDRVSGGVGFSGKYARVHIGTEGQKTIIKPVSTKMLAIPLKAAKTASGVARYKSPRDVSDLHLIKSKLGNLLLAKITGRHNRRKITPWFVLKKTVTILARVHLQEILSAKKGEILQDIRNAIKETLTNKRTR